MAHEFETAGHAWSFGITPKYQRVDLFNYNVSVSNFDKNDIDSSEYRNTKTGFNADVGLSTNLNDNWTLGLAVQNIIPRSIDTKEVNGERERSGLNRRPLPAPHGTTASSQPRSMST